MIFSGDLILTPQFKESSLKISLLERLEKKRYPQKNKHLSICS